MSKNIIFLISMLLVSFLGFSQQTKTQHENFQLNGRLLTWQKIYETDKPIKEVFDYFKIQSLTKDLEIIDSSLIGTSTRTKASPIKNFYWAFSDFTVFITIEYKEGRYRVTLKDFNYFPVETSVNTGSIGLSSQVSTTLSESYVRTNKDEIRKNKSARKYLTVLNNDLVNAFTIKEGQKSKDW